MTTLQIKDIFKRYPNGAEAVKGVSVDVEDGELVVFVGPSGCGKSTMLRMVAGLESVTEGEITLAGRVVNDLEPAERNIAMVFQNYALYPHMSVRKNLAYGLQNRGTPAAEITRKVNEAAELLQINEFLDRKPSQLSGGQRQRVAMGRAIVRDPNVFLFDEPLSNLDAKLRTQMRTEIKKLHSTVATTIIYVTHDQVEAMTLADRIVVLKNGAIEQVGKPEEVYNQPRTIFVAGFIGAPTMNFIPSHLVRRDHRLALELKDGILLFVPADRTDDYMPYCDHDVILGLRPNFFSLTEGSSADQNQNCISSKINVLEPLGSDTLFFFNLGHTEVVASLPPLPDFKAGDRLPLKIDMHKMHLFDPSTERMI